MTAPTRRNETGSMVVEVVLMAPVIVLALMFVAWAISQPAADGAALAAAKAAARAAALSPAAPAATINGIAAGEANADRNTCEVLTVQVDVSDWDRGFVTATATCSPVTTGFEALATGDPLQARWTEPVDFGGRAGR